MSEGKLKQEILKGKVHGLPLGYREMVDASYVWAALDEAKQDFPKFYHEDSEAKKWFKKWLGK